MVAGSSDIGGSEAKAFMKASWNYAFFTGIQLSWKKNVTELLTREIDGSRY